MAILPKGGVNIAGHKIPWEAIAAIAGVAGVILVIRARQQGQNVASVGQAPAASAIDPSLLGFGSTSPDFSGALANLSQQLTNLQQGGVNTAPALPGVSSLFGLIRQSGGVPSWDTSHGGIPLDIAPGDFTGLTAPFGSSVAILGSQQGPANMGSDWWYLIQSGSQEGWISAFDLSQLGGAPFPPSAGSGGGQGGGARSPMSLPGIGSSNTLGVALPWARI